MPPGMGPTGFSSRATKMKKAKNLVDVGGAGGAFITRLAERVPQLHGTVFDLPQMRPVAEFCFIPDGMEERITFHAGDFFNDPFPPSDARSLGYVRHDWSTAPGSPALLRIAKASPPGGLFIRGSTC